MRYKVCRENISPMETKTEQQEAVTQELADDTIVTQEPTIKEEPPVIIYLEVNPQEPVEANPIVEETKMYTEATLGGNEGADTQEPIEEAIVTQEPAVEVEQPHLAEVVTPIIDVDIEFRRMLGPVVGWSSEKILLISELQKWKQEEISLQEGVILWKEHQKEISSL